jgi:cell division protein FtsB
MKKVRYRGKSRSKKNRIEENLINRILNSGLGQIVLLGVSVLMLLSVYRSFRQMAQKISLLKQAEQEVNELRLKNLELSLRIEETGGVENLEKEARDRLNYGRENEVVFVIEEELVEVGRGKVQAILLPEEEVSEVDVLDEWLDFIVKGY